MLIFDIGIPTLSTYDADGFLSHQYDAEGEANAGAAEYEGHHFLGFMARTLDPVADSTGQPDATQAGQLLIAMEGGRGHAFPLEDTRVVPNLPALLGGESIHYGCAGNFTRMKADGSIVSFTTDAGGAPNGNSIYSSIGAVDALGNLEFNRIAPWGTEHFGQSGYDLLLKSGARIRGGAITGLPAPFDGIGNYWKMSAGMIRLTAGIIALGPQGALDEPATKSRTLLAYLASMQATMQAVYNYAFAVGATPAAVGTAPNLALVALIAAATSALSTTSAPPIAIQSSVTVG